MAWQNMFPNHAPRAADFQIIDPFADGAWDDQVRSYPNHSVFHTSAWARVLAEAYHHRPYYLSFLDGQSLCACLPLMEVNSRFTGKRALSLPFSDSAGAVADAGFDVPGALLSLYSLRREKHWKYLELRGGDFIPADETPGTFTEHVVNLANGPDHVYQEFHPSVRRAIRKAEQSGVEVSIHDSEHAMDLFYGLQQKTRRRHGLPPQPRKFFMSIWTHVISSGMGFVSLCHYSDRVIAGAVFLWSGTRSIFKYGASDDGDWNVRPNQILMWHSIRNLIEKGCKELNLGRSEPGNEGLVRFKHSFGSAAGNLNYGIISAVNQVPHVNIMSDPKTNKYPIQTLPLCVNRMAGTLLYPHLD